MEFDEAYKNAMKNRVEEGKDAKPGKNWFRRMAEDREDKRHGHDLGTKVNLMILAEELNYSQLLEEVRGRVNDLHVVTGFKGTKSDLNPTSDVKDIYAMQVVMDWEANEGRQAMIIQLQKEKVILYGEKPVTLGMRNIKKGMRKGKDLMTEAVAETLVNPIQLNVEPKELIRGLGEVKTLLGGQEDSDRHELLKI